MPKHRRDKQAADPSLEGTTLKGNQLLDAILLQRHFIQHPDWQHAAWLGYRSHANGSFFPIGLPQSRLRPIACCWDFHFFVVTRSPNAVPFLDVPSRFFLLGEPSLEREDDGTFLYYLTATCKCRKLNKKDITKSAFPVSFGIKESCDGKTVRLPVANFWIRPIPTNTTTNRGVVEPDHYVSQSAAIMAIPKSVQQSTPAEAELPIHDSHGASDTEAEVPRSPSSSSSSPSSSSSGGGLGRVKGIVVDVMRLTGKWFPPRQYGPVDDRPTIKPVAGKDRPCELKYELDTEVGSAPVITPAAFGLQMAMSALASGDTAAAQKENQLQGLDRAGPARHTRVPASSRRTELYCKRTSSHAEPIVPQELPVAAVIATLAEQEPEQPPCSPAEPASSPLELETLPVSQSEIEHLLFRSPSIWTGTDTIQPAVFDPMVQSCDTQPTVLEEDLRTDYLVFQRPWSAEESSCMDDLLRSCALDFAMTA